MKSIAIVTLALVALFTPSFPIFGSPLDKEILNLQPKADENGDGKLSKAEKGALKQRIIKRFPRSDSNGDGELSEKELQVVIRIATARAKTQGGRKSGKENAQGKEQTSPTHANVKYGDHERNVFDIWLAESDKPTPLAIYIHGGGFRAGSKEKLSQDVLKKLLKAGISVASINYRYLSIDTPLPTSHHDARRALQFMCSKAKEWNLDKSRIAAFGGSAGAQICMWLAYSDDMAKPKSKDRIERESTRLTCVATSGGQTTNQTEFWKEMITDLMGSKKVSTAPHSIKISNSHHQPFLANASLEVKGPVLASARLRSAKGGKATLQWRTSDQKDFSAKGQSKKFSIKGGDWQDVEIKLPVKGTLRHLRMFVPISKEPLEIDWIELKPAETGTDTKQTKRWDFGTSKMKPKWIDAK